MRRNCRNILFVIFTAVLSGSAFGQTKQQQNVVVNGQSGQAEVINQNGRLFVDMLALASIGRGSVSFSAAGIVLTLPAAASGAQTPAAPPPPVNSSALSREFMKAGIEEIASLREWATTLGSAIRGGYGVTDA